MDTIIILSVIIIIIFNYFITMFGTNDYRKYSCLGRYLKNNYSVISDKAYDISIQKWSFKNLIIISIYIIAITQINILNVYPYLILSTVIIERIYREYINYYLKKINLIELEGK